EARVGETLAQPPGRLPYGADRLREELEVFVLRNHACAYEREIVVIGGDALEHPEQARVGLASEVAVDERRRTDPLHVPQVEVFVAGQPEKAAITARRGVASRHGQVFARDEEAAGCTVLEAAVASARCIEQEQIIHHRRRRSEESDVL